MKGDYKLVYPDYKNCIANIPNSILKAWGLEPCGESLPVLDKYLEKEYKNVVFLLLDGMGKAIIEEHLEEDGFFRSHMVTGYTSVYPPTTVAGTTSAQTGLMPNEHGWLGWDNYYHQIDKTVTVFLNLEQGTKKKAADYGVANRYCPLHTVVSKINEAGGNAYDVTAFVPPFSKTMSDVCERIEKICRNKVRNYIYAYYKEPDGVLHRHGRKSPEAYEQIKYLEDWVEKLYNNLEDTLLIVTADHGHLNVQNKMIWHYPTIMECLKRLPSLEPRVLTFFVKEGMEERFENEFNKEFGDKFLLKKKEDVIKEQIFGTGCEHADFKHMLGQYTAFAIDDTAIFMTEGPDNKFKGMHAGLTEDEMIIPLIICEK